MNRVFNQLLRFEKLIFFPSVNKLKSLIKYLATKSKNMENN